ncbi:hypothetical protein C8A00DRAFT_47410 [Chaetomidium leptoderma]|uniref:Mid2 domain-containing protein n=1 Tax=Chaetomidium leptoderma TaxID=669021 RepID=A0AAN6ZR91_9PEZI|nr:hypothetical protein C8A00DRAFT_47410 [Chaetomidium leptoderma]
MEFISPPPSGEPLDYSDNPIYPVGSVVEVVWTPGNAGKPTSLTLWQLNATTGKTMGNLEYITRKAVDIYRFSWIVATSKDLTVSNLFFLSIFEDGAANGDSNTHYFNINTKGGAAQPATSEMSTASDSRTSSSTTSAETTSAETTTATTKTTSAAETTSTDTAAATTTGSSSGSSSSSDIPISNSNPSGLASGATIGLAVAIPCAIILGAIAGYLILRKRRTTQPPPPIPYHDMTGGQLGGHWAPKPAPGELGQVGSSGAGQYRRSELDAVEDSGRRFELPGNQGWAR